MADQNAPNGNRPDRTAVRAAVLAAAETEFLQHGYLRGSLTAIAGRAGFTKGAIYSNFASKQDLFAELLLQHGEHLAETLIDGLAAETDARLPQRVGRVLAEHLDEVRPWLLLQAEFAVGSGRDREAAEAFHRLRFQQRARLTQTLAANADRIGLPSGLDLTRAALLVLVAMQAFAVESAANPALSREEIAAALATVFAGILTVLTPEQDPS